MRINRVDSEVEIGGSPSTRIVAPHALHAHSVQFYDDDSFVCSVVADYLDAGLANGQPGVVVAEEGRIAEIREALRQRGADPEGRMHAGDLVCVDARELLGYLMVDGVPSEAAFRRVVGGVLERARRGRPGVEVCAHGEMVDLLWREGKPEAAIRLEELWNDLAERQAFSLLCTYGIRNFSSSDDAERFLEVCRQHDHVLPTERFLALEDGARLGEISALQQRAQALEAEVETRREVEARLREVLAAQAELLTREQAARLEAEEANRAKRDFLAVMSHELRTPLNAIAGYAELLELGVHGPVSEPQRDCLERIQRSQQRLLGLIDEVLIFSRTEAGKVRYAMEAVPVADVARAAQLSLQPQMQEREIEVELVCGPGVIAWADRQRLQQILMNLLANAVKFSERGGQVRMTGEMEGAAVVVRVADDGPGIPEEKREAVFQPFYQLDAGLTREHQGAGLGLSISRQFARGMGGEIVVEGGAGAGAVFTVRLGGVGAGSYPAG